MFRKFKYIIDALFLSFAIEFHKNSTVTEGYPHTLYQQMNVDSIFYKKFLNIIILKLKRKKKIYICLMIHFFTLKIIETEYIYRKHFIAFFIISLKKSRNKFLHNVIKWKNLSGTRYKIYILTFNPYTRKQYKYLDVI